MNVPPHTPDCRKSISSGYEIYGLLHCLCRIGLIASTHLSGDTMLSENQAGAPRQMKLGAFLRTAGHHVAAWRHPRSTVDSDVNFSRYVEVAKIAERGLFDMLFWADVQSVPDYKSDTLSRAAYIMRPDPFTLLAALAAVTERIGLVCTASSTYNDPYHIARNFTTLDHVSGGRSGWNLVTSGSPAEALNFS